MHINIKSFQNLTYIDFFALMTLELQIDRPALNDLAEFENCFSILLFFNEANYYFFLHKQNIIVSKNNQNKKKDKLVLRTLHMT